MWYVLAGLALFLWWKGGNLSLNGQETVPQLPGGAGIVQTLGHMRAMTNEAITHPLIRRAAVQATEHLSSVKDKKEGAIAIGEWVRAHVKYVPDPLRVEHLTNPKTMIEAIYEKRKVFGDCDDMSMLVAAMAKSIGMPARFHAVGRTKKFHHVYAEVAGTSVDPTVPLGTKPFKAASHMSLEV